jgi:hypothetical protein
MNNVRFASIIGITAVITNMLLMGLLSVKADIWGLGLRMVLLAVLIPGLFCDAKLTEIVRRSRIIKFVFRLK